MRFRLGRRGVAVATGAVVATVVASTAIAGSKVVVEPVWVKQPDAPAAPSTAVTK